MYIKRRAEIMIRQIAERSRQMRSEMEYITKATAKFAHFLKNNAIVAYNDSFEAYLEHLIENQRILGNNGANNKVIIEGLHNMLKSYRMEKEILDKAMSDTTECNVSAEDVFKSIEELYKLKIYGKKIKESQISQISARNSEIKDSQKEFVYVPMSKGTVQGNNRVVQDIINNMWSKVSKILKY